jgi:hypothetical protein
MPIKDVKFKVSWDVEEVKKASEALHGNESAAKGITEQFNKANDSAAKANKEFQEGGKKSAGVMNVIGTQIKDTVRNIDVFGVNAGQAFDTLNSGVGSGVKGMQLLKLAFISTGIGAFLVALGSLVAYFTRTEEGAEKLERIMAGLGAAFGVVVGKAAELGKTIVDAFENPKQAIIDLGNFILQNIVNRFTSLAVILKGIWSGDLKQIGNGLGQLTTGVVGLTDKTLALGKEMKKASDQAMGFTEVLQQIEDDEDNLALSIAKTRNQIELLIISSKDRGKTDKERVDALKQADKLEQGIINDQITLQKKKVAALKEENDQKVKNGEVDKGNKTAELRQAEIDLENLLGNSIELRGKLQNRIDALGIASAKKKNKDIIDLNTQLINEVNKNASFEEDRNQEKNDKIIISDQDFADIKKDTYKELNDDLTEDQARSLKEQLQDYDRFNAEAEAKAKESANKRKKIQEALKDAAVQIGRESVNAIFDYASAVRDQELQDIQTKQAAELKLAGDNKQEQAIINNKYAAQERALKRKQAQADKEQAVFNILLNTAVGVTKAIAVGPPIGFILAATVAALGAIQLVAAASKPLPKFKRGTKSVPGVDTGEDTVLAMLRPKEKVFSVETSQKYTPALDAIFDHKVPADLINSFVLDQKKFDRSTVVNQYADYSGLEKKLDRLIRVTESKPVNHVNIDKNGLETYVVSSNNKTKTMNNYFVA